MNIQPYTLPAHGVLENISLGVAQLTVFLLLLLGNTTSNTFAAITALVPIAIILINASATCFFLYCIAVEAWRSLVVMFDENGDGDLTWEELKTGIQRKVSRRSRSNSRLHSRSDSRVGAPAMLGKGAKHADKGLAHKVQGKEQPAAAGAEASGSEQPRQEPEFTIAAVTQHEDGDVSLSGVAQE
jgi:hypothetical protein